MSHQGAVAALLAAAFALLLTRSGAADTRTPLSHAFTLVDADGTTVTSDGFPGKWLLIYFGYTHCADQCPTALSAMTEALDEIGPAAAQIQPLFITIDPQRDRGLGLRAFTAAFDKRMVGLTGTPEQIADAAAMLGVEYQKVLAGGDDYVIDHSSKLSLVAPERREAVSFAFAEPYSIAAKLIGELERAGVALRGVNNLGAYR